MYEVELSGAAVIDLDDLSETEVQEVVVVLLGLEENPRPATAQPIPLEEAADRMAYLYETDAYTR